MAQQQTRWGLMTTFDGFFGTFGIGAIQLILAKAMPYTAGFVNEWA